MSKKPLRKIMGISFNPVEQEMIELMMLRSGYSNFSEFAKAKILGEVSDFEKRLRSLETAIDNLREAYERQHAQWVKTVKSVSGSDSEPLVAAIYSLLHMMARPQDRAVMDSQIDMRMVESTVKGDGNGYRKV